MNLVEAARTFDEVPFKHQGRTRLGLDCLGLVKLAADMQDEVDIEIEDHKGYSELPDGEFLKAECDRQFKQADINNLKDGDILLMKFRHHPQHLAIKTNHGIIHSYSGVGKVSEHGLDDKWRSRIVAVYTL